MEKLLVISDEPALALALADELPNFTIITARADALPVKATAEVKLIIAERAVVKDEGSAENIVLSELDIPQLIVTRPVRLRELLYTIEERLQAQTRPGSAEIHFAEGHYFSPRERMLTSEISSHTIQLTEKEAELFGVLLEYNDKNIHREELLKKVWGYSEDVDTHTLETHVYRLRGKLRQLEAGYDIISSPEGGYSLKLEG